MLKRIVDMTRVAAGVVKWMVSPEDYARSVGVRIGTGCKIVTRHFGSEPFLIEIGDHVHVTSDVHFVTHDGGIWVFLHEDPTFDVFGKIRIGSNSYIGNGTTIMPGVSIGSNCVIGGYSVVTKSIPDNTVAAGCPCRFICTIDEYRERMSLLNTGTYGWDIRHKREYLESLNDSRFIRKQMLEIPSVKDE